MDPDFSPILRFLSRETGLCSDSDRAASILDGVRRAMTRCRTPNVDEFLSLIQQDEAVFDDLLAEVTVGETYFFREPEQFHVLRETILPEIASRNDAGHVIRIWSAGCATGEEAWSLAIACRQAGYGDRCHIRATDVSREALHRAQQGRYRKWSFRGPAEHLAREWIDVQEHGWQVRDGLRQHVTFDYLNLALDCYPSLATGTIGCDVILCRNVLIYFDAETTRGVARRLFDSLSPGGWLIMAATDPPLSHLLPVDVVETTAGMLYRRPTEASVSYVAPPPSPVEIPVDDEPINAGLSVFDFDEPATDTSTTSDSTLLTSGDLAVQRAQAALEQGDYAQVRLLTEGLPDNSTACALLIRALTCLDVTEAETVCAAAVDRHSTVGELQYLHAVLLLELERYRDAEQAVRRALFLDRKLAVGHFSLGIILQRSGDERGARRAFRNVCDLCEALSPDTALPLSDGEPAGRLMQMAKQHLAMLGDPNTSPKS